MSAKAIPEGFHAVTPYLSIEGAADAIDFYKRAFGASELYRLDTPDGKVGHAQISIGDSQIFLADWCEEGGVDSPAKLGGSSVGIYLYVEDVDAVFKKAIEAGATELEAVEDKFYGDRTGGLRDPFGHVWWIGTQREVLTPEEINQRAREMFAG